MTLDSNASELLVSGTPASGGVAIGPGLVIDNSSVVVADVDDPAAAFSAAMANVSEQLRSLSDNAREVGRIEASDVLDAQALMAQDPMLSDAVLAALGAGESLEAALDQASEQISSLFAAIDDPYIAARASDVVEVTDRVRKHLAGVDAGGLSGLEAPSVLVAETITAADAAELDPALVLGFITEAGGPTSHVAIIARSLGVAAVVGAKGVVASTRTDDIVALDGGTGDVAIRPSESTTADFVKRRERAEAEALAAERFRGVSVSLGERNIKVSANVGSREDIEQAVEVAAEGIGLIRTEFLFLDRADAPTEDEQFDFYSFAASSFDDPVVIRTFDIGGDKPAPYLDVPEEENPFLGVRGARLYGPYDELFESQIRAMLRAAVSGKVWVMLPMISAVEAADDFSR